MDSENNKQDTSVNWKKAAYILCFYGFFIHFLPSEPYFFQFLLVRSSEFSNKRNRLLTFFSLINHNVLSIIFCCFFKPSKF